MSVSGRTTLDSVSPVPVVNPTGNGLVVLACDHASNAIPDDLGDLGLTPSERRSHVAWDPGALAVSNCMSILLDAPLVAGTVSRLVIDLNRVPGTEQSILPKSEVITIPGNADLSLDQQQDRIDRFYHPFHKGLATILDERSRDNRLPVLVTIHSFTPIYFGRKRVVELGFLHDDDSRLADAMLPIAGTLSDLTIRRNEPYGPEDNVTHTLRRHGISRKLLNVMIEIRSDLITTKAQQNTMATLMVTILERALGNLGVCDNASPTATGT